MFEAVIEVLGFARRSARRDNWRTATTCSPRAAVGAATLALPASTDVPGATLPRAKSPVSDYGTPKP
jgi:hypothetical protein